MFTMNVCITCGCQRHPAAKVGNCRMCHEHAKKLLKVDEWIAKLQTLGYQLLSMIDHNTGSHSKVVLKNLSCDHTFEAKLNNVLSRRTKCGKCGPITRMRPAFKAWYERNKRTYDLTEWNDYRDYVRALSEETYQANYRTINPLGLTRSRADLDPEAGNLDHIVPIIYGFKRGLAPELLSDARNLRVVLARSNLQKKQRLTAEGKIVLKGLLAPSTK